MINSQKYLKDELLIKDFISDYIDYCKRNKKDSVNLESLSLFFREEAKPTLTEDERVILRNIDTDNYKAIGRKNDMLYLVNTATIYGGEDDKEVFWYCFHRLFQFIKERRKI